MVRGLIFSFFSKEDNFRDFLFASVGDISFQKGLLIKEITCFERSKFFPFRLTPIKKGGKNENCRVTSPEGVPINLKEPCTQYSFHVPIQNIIQIGLKEDRIILTSGMPYDMVSGFSDVLVQKEMTFVFLPVCFPGCCSPFKNGIYFTEKKLLLKEQVILVRVTPTEKGDKTEKNQEFLPPKMYPFMLRSLKPSMHFSHISIGE